MFARDADALVKLLYRRVRHDAAVFNDRFPAVMQDFYDRVIDAVPLD